MKWILGIDLRPDCLGAVRMAAWLDAVTEPPARQRYVGVHVVPRAPRVAVRDDEVDELLAKAESAASRTVREQGADKAVDRVEAVMGPDPHERLAAACDYHHADALLIGRQAASDREAIVRLGRVARRLIRELPAAVAIVPPDYAPDPATAGPIVAATDLSDDSVAAARFGLQLARELGVDLHLVHVRHGSEYALAPAPDDEVDESAIERWMRQYGLGGAQAVIEAGDPVNRVLSVAHRAGASLILCGSRHLSGVQRVFQASTGTDLARFSPLPVMVVPPESINRVPG